MHQLRHPAFGVGPKVESHPASLMFESGLSEWARFALAPPPSLGRLVRLVFSGNFRWEIRQNGCKHASRCGVWEREREGRDVAQFVQRWRL